MEREPHGQANMNAQPSSDGTGQTQGLTSRPQQILGLSVDELAGLSIDELTGNKTAITMVIHYYKQLVDDNSALRNEVNTLRTYVSGYAAKKNNARVGAFLLLCANICIGFGVNLLTDGQMAPGLATLAPGLVLAGFGTFFSLKSE